MGDGGSGRVLVVSDVLSRTEAHGAWLAREGIATLTTNEVAAACERLRAEAFDAVLADLGASEVSCLAVVRSAARAQPPARVVCIVPEGSSGTRAGGSAIREAEFACLLRGTAAERVVQSVLAAMEAHRTFASMSGAADTAGTGAVARAEVPHYGGGGVSWT